MPNNWGGKRAGAGRKPTYFVRTRAQLLAQAVNPEDWLKVLKRLKEIALSGDPKALAAIALMLRYQFGDPSEPVDQLIERANYLQDQEKKKAAEEKRHKKDGKDEEAVAHEFEVYKSADLSNDDFILGLASESPDLEKS